MLILNPEDIDRELKKLAAHASHPAAQTWIMTIAKKHILNLDGTDRDANFRVYDPANIKPGLYGDPPLFDKLPDWAKEAIEHGEPLHWFDPIQVGRRRVWETIENILNWFNRNGEKPTDTDYTQLSFPEAAQKAVTWRAEAEQRWKENLLKHITERKVSIDRLADDLKNQLTNKKHQIRDARTDASDLPQRRAEMKCLQGRLGTEPEAATRALCDEIQRKTGLTDVFKRNTDATNQNLKGEEWAKFVLGMG
jgi:hypothetical protein